MPFLTTPRLHFRTWRRADRARAIALFRHPDVSRYIHAARPTLEESAARFEREIATQQKHGVQYWPIFLRDDDRLVGCAGLRPYGSDARVFELGVHLLPAYWGKGLAKEAATAVIAYAFSTLGARSLFAGHNPKNEASRGLLLRLGFRHTHDELYAPTGSMHPSYVLSPVGVECTTMSEPHVASSTSGSADGLVNLAEERLGASVLYASDDFFAEKENLLKPQKAVFIEGEYTDRGKWMDGWESRRKRVPGHDFAIVRLGVPGAIHEVVVDTAFFKGNFPESCSLEGAVVSGYPQPDELVSDQIAWTEILPRTKLKGDTENRFPIASRERFTHVRLHIYPDGGVARLRVLGEVLAEPRWMGRPGSTVDLAAVEHGGVVVACNDMFFGSRHNLITPNRALDMGDGWETKRSRREGPDWVIVKLAGRGQIERIVLDTAHFKGNFPESASVCVGTFGPKEDPVKAKDTAWTNVLPRTKLTAHTAHVFDEGLGAHGPATHARLRIWPDGGVSRMRLFGVLSDEGREEIGLRALNALPAPDAQKALLSTCASTAWASAMAKKRPYKSLDDLITKGRDLWAKATEADILQAFAAHPRIGEKAPAPTSHATAQSKSWSSGEQSKVTQASERAKKRLAAANAAYEKKFGRIYIVCATGKTAEEMVAIAEKRLKNGPAKELKVAAAEQGKITELRLRKLVTR